MIDVSVSACHVGDCRELLRQLPDGCVQTCVTSPPYLGLRDYGVEGQLGLEATPEEYVSNMVAVFAEVSRVLRDDGTLWLNLGDSYASCAGGYDESGSRGATAWNSIGAKTQSAVQKGRTRKPPAGLKPKDLVGIPWMTAFALRASGWYLRSDIIWHKPNPMPESVEDRPTKSHEHVFLLSKSASYFYDADAIREKATVGDHRRNGTPNGAVHAPGQPKQAGLSKRRTEGADAFDRETRNKRDVWTVATHPYPEAHFATFPPDLIKPCILAGSRTGDLVLDPFFGSGTTGMVAETLGRRWIGFDINAGYAELAKGRTAQRGLAL